MVREPKPKVACQHKRESTRVGDTRGELEFDPGTSCAPDPSRWMLVTGGILEPEDSELAWRRTMDVVVVSDSGRRQELWRHLVMLAGVEVRGFGGTSEALTWCQDNQPDLIFLDVCPNEMSAGEFLARARIETHLEDVPVVMLSREGGEERLREALTMGASDYIRAPLEALEIETRARHLLSQRLRQLELGRANDRLYELATTDALTGASNRRHFMAQLAHEFKRAQRYGHPLSVAMMDADHFKGVNDAYGHAVGDRVLISLTQMSRISIRSTDLFGRLGGEEFAFCMPNTTAEQARMVCERLRAEVEGHRVCVEEEEVAITVSVGVAELAPGCETPEELLNRADIAMYEAKELGRNKVR